MEREALSLWWVFQALVLAEFLGQEPHTEQPEAVNGNDDRNWLFFLLVIFLHFPFHFFLACVTFPFGATVLQSSPFRFLLLN